MRTASIDPYQQRQRSSADILALQTLQGWLEKRYGSSRHLSAEQVRTPRHLLKPFPLTLHLAICQRCARANIKKGGRWEYPPTPGSRGEMIG